MGAAVVASMLVLLVPVLSTEPNDAVDPAPPAAPYGPYAKAVVVASEVDPPDDAPDSLVFVATAPSPSSSPPDAMLPAVDESALGSAAVAFEENELEPVPATALPFTPVFTDGFVDELAAPPELALDGSPFAALWVDELDVELVASPSAVAADFEPTDDEPDEEPDVEPPTTASPPSSPPEASLPWVGRVMSAGLRPAAARREISVSSFFGLIK